MAINTGKVVVGGLAAGVVANVLGYLLFALWLGSRFEAEAVAAAPTLAGRGMGGGALAVGVITTFVLGILLVWLYAAMRPRFGPGAKTAVYAALVVWVCGFIFHLDMYHLGLITTATYMLASVAALVQLLGAAWVGGMVYKEDTTAPAM